MPWSSSGFPKKLTKGLFCKYSIPFDLVLYKQSQHNTNALGRNLQIKRAPKWKGSGSNCRSRQVEQYSQVFKIGISIHTVITEIPH
jgi:hypothetical protein